MELAIIVIVSIVIISILSGISFVKSNKKIKSKIDAEFGKKPKYQNYYLDDIAEYHRLKNTDNAVDHITWDDLDMDLVYKRINACNSSVGEEYLYHIMHSCNADANAFAKREKLMDYLKANANERKQLQFYLARLGKTPKNGLYEFIKSKKQTQGQDNLIFNIFAILPLAAILIFPFNLPAGVLCFTGAFCINIILYYYSKRTIGKNITVLAYLSSMLWCCNNMLKTSNPQTNAFLQDIKKDFQVVKPLCGKVPVVSESFSDADMFLEYIKILFLMDIRNYNKAIKVISSNFDVVDRLYQNLGELDAAISILSYRESLPYFCLPHFGTENKVEFNNIYHPLIDEAVANDSVLDKSCIITGSNASGKSTFIKAVAINAILAQSLNTCLATSFTTRKALVISSMAVSDDISQGDSYFITEIKSLKRILDKVLQTPCLCFIDEILKGTNTIERVAASAAVLKYLQNTNCLCIVATHDIELTKLLQNEYLNFHFSEQITDNGVEFDYLIKQGPSKTRNAIKLLHFMNFDNTIVEQAEALAQSFASEQKLI